MGNATVAEELVGLDELEGIYKLTATETEPDSGEEDDEEDEEGEEGEEGAKPGVMPQG